jgi:beta-glucanase (GH16 family)
LKSVAMIFFATALGFGVEFCSSPAFEDDFDGTELSNAWKTSTEGVADSAASIFSPLSVAVTGGKLALSISLVGTTDDTGKFYRATSGEVVSNIEFGFGIYEVRLQTRGHMAVGEAFRLLWYEDDYYEDRQSIALNFFEQGFYSVYEIGPADNDKSEVRHNTDFNEASNDFELLNEQAHTFKVEYTSEGLSWYYDGVEVRKEVATLKEIPTQPMRVIFYNWLDEMLQYNVTSADMPVDTTITSFKFTPVDEGGTSCDPIPIPTTTTNSDGTTTVDGDTTVVITDEDLKALQNTITLLQPNNMHLVGYTEAITNLSVFQGAKVVWIYSNGSWQGYSPYSKVRTLLEANDITVFEEIPAYSGFWIQK